MPCTLRIDDEVKSDILLYSDDPGAYKEIDQFLMALEENPYPENRRALNEKAEVFYAQLKGGLFLSWQILQPRSGKLARQLSLKKNDGLIVRILAIARSSPIT